MEQLFTYWSKHFPALNPESRAFIIARSRHKSYGKGQVIKLATESFPFFCIVLSGLAAGYRENSVGKQVLCELMQPMDYFTGTQHPFTPRLREAEYVAIADTKLLLVPVMEAREAQRRFPAFAELLHVLKQRKINFLELLVALEHEETCYARYCLYMDRFGGQIHHLPDAPKWQLLRMGRSTYYRMKRRYLKDGR
ncbi:Crp/Fnr family transcriptional regulator [Parapedobacter sp. 10938]|uniref:Crp/Fnr family transcriptional regulator n=1 Tax=Parapedobacter flavus TaxID=3110225 RepID=UPI002DBED1F7|nr:cyclic nucleotide-binding domain-containing protein [Parapedobacter sp. 10938]MEC3879749.1 cyclic nucleotide-binding domain-containing protein [Parapedobacter sp. 10938]